MSSIAFRYEPFDANDATGFSDIMEIREHNTRLKRLAQKPTNVEEYMSKLRKCAICGNDYCENDNISEWTCDMFHPGRYVSGERECCGDKDAYTLGCARGHHSERRSSDRYGSPEHMFLAVPVWYIQKLASRSTSEDSGFAAYFLLTDDKGENVCIRGHLQKETDPIVFYYARIDPAARERKYRKKLTYGKCATFNGSYMFLNQALMPFVRSAWRDQMIRSSENEEFRIANEAVANAQITTNNKNTAVESDDTEEDEFQLARYTEDGVYCMFIQRFEFPRSFGVTF